LTQLLGRGEGIVVFDAYKDEHLLNSLREECAQADKPFMSFDLSKDSPEGITFNSELAILDQQGGVFL
tara:strand:+ start:550 stop:753 length:204 start_codon:yes stop_codon:yes gene_type:complete